MSNYKARLSELKEAGTPLLTISRIIYREYGIRLKVESISKAAREFNPLNSPQNSFNEKSILQDESILKMILNILNSSNKPLTARNISANIRIVYEERITKGQINKLIYSHLKDDIYYDRYLFTYSLKNTPKLQAKELNSSEELLNKKFKILFDKIDFENFTEQVKSCFKNELIQVSTGIEKIDYLIKSVVKDNVITECEEIFLVSKAKEFGYSKDIISDAKKSLEQNNPYLDNLIHIIFDDGLITPEELVFLKEKAAENDFSESFVNERFWMIGLAEYLHHLTRCKPLDEVITLAFFLLKLNSSEDNFTKLYKELNIFISTDLSTIASEYIDKLKAVINVELEKEFGFKYNYASYILKKFTLSSKDKTELTTKDSSEEPNVNLEKFMKLLNQERLRIGSPDVNLLVENINYRIENDLWD